MPQQINLSSPLLLKEKHYFSARTMALALTFLVVVGGALCAGWVWNLQNASKGYNDTMAAQARELASLQAAIQSAKASAAPPDPVLVQQAQERRRTAQQRGQLLQALREGMFRPGEGHSDRLQLLASSIPAPVWVTEVKADASRFELTGFTLEPSALNVWVDKLSLSPLMRGLKLATVKVESTALAQLKVPAAAASTPAASSRAVWAFNLVSAEPVAVAPVIAASGPKP